MLILVNRAEEKLSVHREIAKFLFRPSDICIHITWKKESAHFDIYIYMLFTGRDGRIGKNCARGLEYGPRPAASGRTRDLGHSFSQYGPTKAGE